MLTVCIESRPRSRQSVDESGVFSTSFRASPTVDTEQVSGKDNESSDDWSSDEEATAVATPSTNPTPPEPPAPDESDDDWQSSGDDWSSSGDEETPLAQGQVRPDDGDDDARVDASILGELREAVRHAKPRISPQAARLKEAQQKCLESLRELLGEEASPRAVTPVKRLLDRVEQGQAQRIQIRCAEVVKSMQRLWAAIVSKPPEKLDEPIFCFRDGPLTNCVVNGGAIVLEDFDLPNQAVTERLNSLFEPDRSFSLQEDISRDVTGKKQTNSIPIPDSFQVFATVNSQPGQTLKISPATRSRFTEIQCPAYGSDEIKLIIQNTLQDRGLKHESSKTVTEKLLELYDEVDSGARRGGASILPLFKVCEFVCSQLEAADALKTEDPVHLKHETLKGARFLMLDSLPVKEMERIGRLFLKDDKTFDTIFGEPRRRLRADEAPPLVLQGADLLVSTFGSIRYGQTQILLNTHTRAAAPPSSPPPLPSQHSHP